MRGVTHFQDLGSASCGIRVRLRRQDLVEAEAVGRCALREVATSWCRSWGEGCVRYGPSQRQDAFEVPDRGPSVIDADYLPDDDEPPEDVARPASSSVPVEQQAFIPSLPVEADDTHAQVELRPTEQGKLALLCYESLELLLAACGNQQAWISVRRGQVDDVLEYTDADVVLWNASLPDEVRKDDEEG